MSQSWSHQCEQSSHESHASSWSKSGPPSRISKPCSNRRNWVIPFVPSTEALTEHAILPGNFDREHRHLRLGTVFPQRRNPPQVVQRGNPSSSAPVSLFSVIRGDSSHVPPSNNYLQGSNIQGSNIQSANVQGLNFSPQSYLWPGSYIDGYQSATNGIGMQPLQPYYPVPNDPFPQFVASFPDTGFGPFPPYSQKQGRSTK